jgi:hypothetical protein
MQRISKLPVTLPNRVLDAFEGKERRRSKSKSMWRMVVEDTNAIVREKFNR